jgi:hypothetical protein
MPTHRLALVPSIVLFAADIPGARTAEPPSAEPVAQRSSRAGGGGELNRLTREVEGPAKAAEVAIWSSLRRWARPAASTAVIAARRHDASKAKAAGPPFPTISLHDPAAVLPLRMAVEAARRKLGEFECQRLLDDFRDGQGHSLRENLAALGLGPAEYLSVLAYHDGGDLPNGRCRWTGAAAITHTGDRIVYLCAASFRAQTPDARANTLIHEMLHSLGLGENPPSSGEINGQVRRRCGT